MTKENINKLLQKLNFKKSEKNFIYTKKYNNKILEIDTKNENIKYSEFGIKVGDKTTSNFSSDENFVVLECVDKLLTKGYQSNHIELEPRWKLGHTGKSGKADILVRDMENRPLLIIECKTYGKEFDSEIKQMRDDGGQLFSYFAQERATKYLCLYASRLNKNSIEYQNRIIKTSKEYEEAKNSIELFNIWANQFALSFNDNGIFDDDIQAYNIELRAKKRKDLKPLPKENKIYNQFMEILRHHNISDKEKAFNKIISLFLCKIADETKMENEELAFQYKNGIDDVYSMQDKLLNLFHIGMRDYLKQNITYIKESEIEEDFKHYTIKVALQEVLKKFREIKYHSNNEFTFIDVHNQELFFENAKVLKEVIELFQDYQFSYTHKEQILGNFFENMLSKGFKQSEGQFFTPVPIAKFIIMSIPIKELILERQKKSETHILPYVMDYACGSAHFLTEIIDEISYISKEINLEEYKNDTTWVKEHIFGIEKDYRLSRTAKVACFLNGAGETNIIYGDGLKDYDGIQKNKFDIIIANPPYSVKDFKNFSKLKSNDYSLFDNLTNSSSEIEVLFIERTAQLLKVGGYAGIILPSSILSNSGIYSKARRLLVENFYIKSIVEFGSNTFGATTIRTVTLFLQKRDITESAKLTYQNISLDKENDKYSNDNYLELYCKKLEINYEDYQNFLNSNLNQKLKESEFYKDYQKWFDNLTSIKEIKKKKYFKELSEVKKLKKLKKEFFIKVLENEKKKFKYFSLCLNQKTTIIKTGEKQSEKDFLGYEWSNRKGSEGIKIYQESQLFDEIDKDSLQKANTYIKKAFLKDDIEIDNSLKENVFNYNLIDMIDFKKIDFEVSINLNKKKKINFNKIWNTNKLILLYKISEIKKGSSITKKDVIDGNIPVIAGGKKLAYYHNQSNRKGNVITVSASGANAGYVNYFINEIFASDCTTIQAKNEYLTKYIFICLEIIQNEIYKLQRGQAQPHVYPKDLENLPIPLLKKTIQQQVVDEIEYIDKNGINFSTSDILKYQKELKKEKSNILYKYLKEKKENK